MENITIHPIDGIELECGVHYWQEFDKITVKINGVDRQRKVYMDYSGPYIKIKGYKIYEYDFN